MYYPNGISGKSAAKADRTHVKDDGERNICKDCHVLCFISWDQEHFITSHFQASAPDIPHASRSILTHKSCRACRQHLLHVAEWVYISYC